MPFLSCVALASMECSVDEDVLFSVPSSFSQSKGNHVKDASSGSFIAFQEDSIAYFVKNEPNLFSVFGIRVYTNGESGSEMDDPAWPSVQREAKALLEKTVEEMPIRKQSADVGFALGGVC